MLVTVTFRIPPKDVARIAQRHPDAPGPSTAIARAIRDVIVKEFGLPSGESNMADGGGNG